MVREFAAEIESEYRNHSTLTIAGAEPAFRSQRGVNLNPPTPFLSASLRRNFPTRQVQGANRRQRQSWRSAADDRGNGRAASRVRGQAHRSRAGLGRGQADVGRDSSVGADAGRDSGVGADAGRDGGVDADAGRDSGVGVDAGRDSCAGADTGRDSGAAWPTKTLLL